MAMSKTIRVLTYNVKMLPGPGGSKRGRDIAAAILAANPRFDIVCLQEVFDEDIREILVKRLKPKFRHMIAKSSDNDFLQEDSGLFFASRYPIDACRFEEFHDAQPWTFDYMADKGVQGVRLRLPASFKGLKLLVFNTHLQSTEAYHEVRARQLMQISRFLQKAVLVTQAKAAVILVGDMNVIGENPGGEIPTEEYRRMISLLGYPRDLFREMQPDEPGYTWDGPANKMIPRDDEEQLRLDYVFAFDRQPLPDDNRPVKKLKPVKCEACRVLPFNANGKSHLSDHFGVDAQLRYAV